MGCGSSGNVVASHEDSQDDLDKAVNEKNLTNGHDGHNDDLPTVVLPDTPVKPKPPIAFEIPLEEFGTNRPVPTTPPPHLQRLLQPPQAEISLPDIEEKLAEAEQRRHSILQQRAASAQKRAQKMMRSVHEMDILDSEIEPMDIKNNIDLNMDRVNAPIIDSYKHNMMDSTTHHGNERPIMGNEHNNSIIHHVMEPIKDDNDKAFNMEHLKTPMNNQMMGIDMHHATAPVMKSNKHNPNSLTIPPGPRVREDKNI